MVDLARGHPGIRTTLRGLLRNAGPDGGVIAEIDVNEADGRRAYTVHQDLVPVQAPAPWAGRTLPALAQGMIEGHVDGHAFGPASLRLALIAAAIDDPNPVGVVLDTEDSEPSGSISFASTGTPPAGSSVVTLTGDTLTTEFATDDESGVSWQGRPLAPELPEPMYVVARRLRIHVHRTPTGLAGTVIGAGSGPGRYLPPQLRVEYEEGGYRASVTMTWTDGEADSPGEPTSHPGLAPDTPIALAPATPADEQEARGLRDRGFDLVLHGRHGEAVAPLRAALAWYSRVLNGIPDGHRSASDGISAINITTRLAVCAVRLRDEELLLDALTTALKLRTHVAADPNLTGLALEGAAQLADWLDTWRWLLAEDAERVLAQEAAAPLVRELASLLMRVGDPAAALVVSEHARARSLVDLLSARAISGTVRALADPELGHALAGPTDIQAIQHVVDEHGSAILEYFEGDGALYGWLLRPGQPVHTFTVPAPPAEVMRNAERLAEGLAIPVGDLADDVADLLEGLHAVLLSPIRYLLPVDIPLVVVPSSALSMVPFEALGPRDGPALAEEISVAYAPSVMALGRLGGSAPRPTGGLLALATDEAAALITDPDPGDDAIDHLLAGLAALGPTRGYRGKNATSVRLAEQAGTARIVVLLAHGQVMPDPADSYLQLAPSGDDDGRLTAREVAALTIPAELVILAACETGAGRIAAEGVLGLARGFLWAGVRSVVASRWTVPAETTLNLVYTLVEGEAAGLTLGAAFTAAQRRLRWLYPAQPARLGGLPADRPLTLMKPCTRSDSDCRQIPAFPGACRGTEPAALAGRGDPSRRRQRGA